MNGSNRKPTGAWEFTIMDLSRFLNKSPATIRKWEANGLFSFPRDENDVRRFSTTDIRDVLIQTHEMGRIDLRRRHMVESLMTILDEIEVLNK